MTLTSIILTEQTQSLGRIIGLTGKADSYKDFNIGSLPKSLKVAMLSILANVATEEVTEDDTAFAIKFDENGDFSRAFPPSLVKNEESQLCIRLGSRLVPLNLETNESIEVSVLVKKLGNFEEPCLVYSQIDEDDNEIILPLSIRMSKETYDSFVSLEGDKKVFSPRKLSQIVKKQQWDRLVAVVLEGKTGGGGNPITSIKDLPERTPFLVTGTKLIPTKNGDTYLLNITHEDEEYTVFAPSKVKTQLFAGYVPTEESYVEYYLNEKGHVKSRITNLEYVVEDEEEELSI